MLDRAIIGEGLFVFDSLANFSGPMGVRRRAVLGEPLRQLAYPATAGRTLMSLHYLELMKAGRLPWPEFRQWADRNEDRVQKAYAFAPLFSNLAPAISRIYEAEWRVRTQFDLAITALAVERYRLAQGQLPESLTQLVPAFLPAVPKDYFSPTGGPILYRPEADGNFVVYSVSRDMEDDGGERMERWYHEGDITFSVVSRGVD